MSPGGAWRRVLMFTVTLTTLGVSAWLAYGAMLWSLQDLMVFPAPGGISRASLDDAAAELGVEPLDLVADDGTRLYGWHRPASGQRIVLYLPGNAETVASSLALQRWLAQRGWDVAVVAYRGYPGSEGKPSEEGVILDALALYRHATTALGFPPERVVVHGKSLGGGVAVGLATRVRPAALVLESTFTSVLRLARIQAPLYPVERLLRHPFRSDLRAPEVRSPTLILHGDADRVIPVEHGRELARLVPGARYVESRGRGHDDGLALQDPASRAAYLALLDEVAP